MSTVPQPWRNGGGMTRELLVWPAGSTGQDWQLRITLAEVTQDGPFSPFPEVRRHFVVVNGCGLSLRWVSDDQWQELRPGHAPLLFDGALPPDCRLLREATEAAAHSTDLNLMTRNLHGHMQPIQQGQAMLLATEQRGFFAAQAGHWWCGDTPAQPIAAHTLVWQGDGLTSIPPEDWHFEPLATNTPDRPLGWWLGADGLDLNRAMD